VTPTAPVIEAAFEIGSDHCICAWSPEAEQLWGWSAAEALGMPVAKLVPHRNRERQRRHLAAVLQTHEALGARDITARHREGREFKVTLVGSVRCSNGTPRVAVRATGMTPRAWAEATFSASEGRFRMIVEQMNDGCSVVDLRGNLLFVNPAYCQLYGFVESDLVGTHFREHLGPRCAPDVVAAIHDAHAEVYRTGQPVRGFEFSFMRGGDNVTVQMSVSIERDAAGEPIGFMAISRDVTRRARAERDAARAREVAEAANRAKSEFLANMSHEIRTPMNGIIGMTELALSTELTDVQRDYLQTVRGSAESLLVVINDILDFSKIEAGKLEVDAVDFSLRAVLDDAVRTVALRAHQKGLELAVDVRPFMPDRFLGDPHRLRQVLVNLLGNAIKFTNEGEVVVRVTSAPVTNNRARLQIHVVDTGIGIPRDRHDTIFKAFEQADGSTTRRFGGTGLGLTISSRLVTLMGGTLRVDSEPGHGSDFQFALTLPLSSDAAVAPQPAPYDSLSGLAALVVDDNETNLRILAEMLGSCGMTVVTAADAVAAQAAVAAAPHVFSLALLDMQLGQTSGIDLATALRRHQRCASAAVLILASADHQRDARDVAALGNARYVVKPVGRAALLESIMSTLGARSVPSTLPAAPDITPGRAAQHLRVLVAEDNVVNVKVADNLLRRRGHSPFIVPNGREAVEAIARGHYDLVLMDLQMPEMDGFEATAAIRALQRRTGLRTPIVALTAHAMETDRQRCLDADMDGYVSKPVKAVELFEVIDRVIAASTFAPAATPDFRALASHKVPA
jgi:two-component system, sensor histidine kinase and response regulator